MKQIGAIRNFTAGISDSPKVGLPGSFAFARNIDFRSDPTQFTINPKAIKQAGTLIKDLPMWMDQACGNLYAYGNTGTIYKKDLLDNWTIEQQVPNSSGNGLCYFAEDGYLYYGQDTTIGRRSEACSDGTYYNSFLESEGGEPTNTKSITFVRSSSQYASIADNASLSITGDLTLESYVKLATFPAVNEIQTILSKWNENGNQRSYKFDITTTSNFFGDGRDGALTISTNTTEDPVDANCTGTTGEYVLTLTNAHASFASVVSGDKVLIYQSRGTGAGKYQVATVQTYGVGGILTLQEALSFSPLHSATASDANKAQVRVLKQYTNVTVTVGFTYTAKMWNGLKGGILGWYANGTTTINGTVTASSKGYVGGTGFNQNNYAAYGEGTNGQALQLGYGGFPGYGSTNANNGNGGGASNSGSGAGGGNGTAGATGIPTVHDSGTRAGIGGAVTGTADLSTMTFGGGAGGSIGAESLGEARGGGNLFISSSAFTVTGAVTSDGQAGSDHHVATGSGGSGGAGGSILVRCQTATLGTGIITANGGRGGTRSGNDSVNGVAGGVGRITVYYSSMYSGTTTPAATYILDNTLSNVTGYILRLLISSNGTNSEIYSVNITNLAQLDNWYRWAVTWNSSTSVATFYQNATQIGQITGGFHQIYNSTARFALATSYDSSGTAVNFLDAKMDDTRVWNDIRNSGELVIYNDRVLTGVDANLSAYYKFEDNVNDSQTWTSTSNLTATNSPTYSTDVPFSGVTTRADADVLIDASGSTYTLGTVLSEAAVDRQTFQPTKEPVKSLELNINTVGTGDWTVVVHDGLNRLVASVTVPKAQLHTGVYEFIFSTAFRPILTANYHVHVYSTVADGKIVSSVHDDMEGTTANTGAYLATFFQILVNDVYHPMTQFLNFLLIGNERYVAKLEAGNIYNPHQLVLPAGYRVRCFAPLGEYIAIGVWKGDSITDTDQGKCFIWDGASDVTGSSAPNTIIEVLDGGVNTMNGAAGTLSTIAGYKGKLLQYASPQFRKVTQLPLLDISEYAEFAPAAMAMWKSVLRFGGTFNTDSSSVHQGVYSYGSLNVNYPPSLSLDYSLSLGDQTSTSVKVGCLFVQGQKLYVGWQNDNAFGIDMVSDSNGVSDSATLECLISDFGKIYKLKFPLVFRVDFKPLVDGQTVTIKYKPDRNSSWLTLATEDTVDADYVIGEMQQGMKEVQLALDITTAGEQFTCTGITLEAEDFDAKGIS